MQTDESDDLYAVLGLTVDKGRSASVLELARAYRRAALIHHPDRNREDPEGSRLRFEEAFAAFELLKDPVKRQQYHALLDRGQHARQHVLRPNTRPSPSWVEQRQSERMRFRIELESRERRALERKQWQQREFRQRVEAELERLRRIDDNEFEQVD